MNVSRWRWGRCYREREIAQSRGEPGGGQFVITQARQRIAKWPVRQGRGLCEIERKTKPGILRAERLEHLGFHIALETQS